MPANLGPATVSVSRPDTCLCANQVSDAGHRTLSPSDVDRT